MPDALLSPRLYYTVPEAATALRMSKVTLYRKAQRGEIPSRREGRKVLIPATYVEQHGGPLSTPPSANRGGRPRKSGPDWAQ
jgi:excisionase family DNA binding protein